MDYHYPYGCHWEGWQRVEIENITDTAATFHWWQSNMKKKNVAAIKSTDSRDDDINISEIEIVIFNPYLGMLRGDQGQRQ